LLAVCALLRTFRDSSRSDLEPRLTQDIDTDLP
jgi:hypothetical protein